VSKLHSKRSNLFDLICPNELVLVWTRTLVLIQCVNLSVFSVSGKQDCKEELAKLKQELLVLECYGRSQTTSDSLQPRELSIHPLSMD